MAAEVTNQILNICGPKSYPEFSDPSKVYPKSKHPRCMANLAIFPRRGHPWSRPADTSTATTRDGPQPWLGRCNPGCRDTDGPEVRAGVGVTTRSQLAEAQPGGTSHLRAPATCGWAPFVLPIALVGPPVSLWPSGVEAVDSCVEEAELPLCSPPSAPRGGPPRRRCPVNVQTGSRASAAVGRNGCGIIGRERCLLRNVCLG